MGLKIILIMIEIIIKLTSVEDPEPKHMRGKFIYLFFLTTIVKPTCLIASAGFVGSPARPICMIYWDKLAHANTAILRAPQKPDTIQRET